MRPWQQGQGRPARDDTTVIPRDRGMPPGARWPTADPDTPRPYDQLATQMLPRVPQSAPASEPVGEHPPVAGVEPTPSDTRAGPSLVKASGKMAIATLTSRVTGFAWKVMLAWVAGLSVVYDSFTVANSLPLIINELLLGGVLTSVIVPLLVRAQDDPDGGQRYTQRLLTIAATVLLVGATAATLGAPWIVSVLMRSGGGGNRDLATAFAYLLLPGLLVYGLFAVLSAILNAKQIFGPAQWAPVMNNVVIFITIALYGLVPGEVTLNPVRMTEPKVLVLGLGVLTAMTVQALYLIPPLLKSGFRFRFQWGIDDRLKEFGGLALWIVGYVVVSQIGNIINTRVLTGGASGGPSIYSNAWLLFQLPYGVIGVSLLTAIMPRMSRAAADGDTRKLVGDLSYASRLSTLTLLPVSAIMAVAGGSIGIALFSVGKGTPESAGRLGMALAVSAFGLLPYALMMLQMRVFYAMKDSRSPTLIMVVLTSVKIPLLYLAAATLHPKDVVVGVMLVNSLTFVVAAILGQVWLWARLGNLRSRRVLGVILFTLVASALGVLAAILVGMLVPDALGIMAGAWVKLALQGLVGLGVAFGVLIALKVDELEPVTNRIVRTLRRG